MSNTGSHTVVWAEIPVTDLAAGMAFYGAVLDAPLTMNEMGPNPMADFPYAEGTVSGHLYPGTPAAHGAGPPCTWACPAPSRRLPSGAWLPEAHSLAP